LGHALRERGLSRQARHVTEQATAELRPITGTAAACRLTGTSRATLHRRRNPAPPAHGPRRAHPSRLSTAERDAVLAALHSDRFADKSCEQVWATLLDEGVYLCSVATMYRLLREHGQVRQRRAQARHAPRTRPELTAYGPSQVWSWDITKLKGPTTGVYFDLYVMLDIFSRKAVHHRVELRESDTLAGEFITDAVAANGGLLPRSVHADRGTSMTSKKVAHLLSDLGVERSHSRPKTSNDNPFSEAQFKTLKYCPAFPERFANLTDARAFCVAFFEYYNHRHRHSGIGFHTPASVHDNSAHQVQHERTRVLQGAYAASPHRFRWVPLPPPLPEAVHINPPRPEGEGSNSDLGEHAA
ncbi:IS3 family transposase, partial [Nocardiopsis rhodophaea]